MYVRIKTLFVLGVAVSAILTAFSGTGTYLAYRDFTRAYAANRLADDVITGVYQLTALTGDYILYFSNRAEDQWLRKSQALGKTLADPEVKNSELEKKILKFRRYHQKIDTCSLGPRRSMGSIQNTLSRRRRRRLFCHSCRR